MVYMGDVSNVKPEATQRNHYPGIMRSQVVIGLTSSGTSKKRCWPLAFVFPASSMFKSSWLRCASTTRLPCVQNHHPGDVFRLTSRVVPSRAICSCTLWWENSQVEQKHQPISQPALATWCGFAAPFGQQSPFSERVGAPLPKARMIHLRIWELSPENC